MANKRSGNKQQVANSPSSLSYKGLLRSGRLWLTLAGCLFCAVVIYMSDLASVGLASHFDVERARVVSVPDTNLRADLYMPTVYVGTQRVLLEIGSGRFAGEQIEIIHNITRFENLHVRDGMEVLVSILPDVDYLSDYHMSVYGPSRGPVLLGAVGLLLVSMLIMGRAKGFFAAIALGFTLITVLFFMVSFIVRGHSPVVFSLITAVLTTAYTLFMVSGVSRQSLAAVAGTWIGLVFAGLLSVLLGQLGNVSGLHLEDARQMLYHSPPDVFLRIPEMFFAGVIIAASGVVVDAAMSISSAVFEIKEQSPGISARRLYKSGMTIGGDIMGANSNTLILAFTGASLPTVILVVLFGFTPLRVMGLDFVAVEIIQSVSATMGMIFAIPATALFSAWLATYYDKRRT
ncbi:MAG: YibE/F family protein [Defluviitaleaceae bacterium]|nr:YibE/F family protein [Defluviitaleaceae bacterium]